MNPYEVFILIRNPGLRSRDMIVHYSNVCITVSDAIQLQTWTTTEEI
jgi:hypothetical protein